MHVMLGATGPHRRGGPKIRSCSEGGSPESESTFPFAERAGLDVVGHSRHRLVEVVLGKQSGLARRLLGPRLLTTIEPLIPMSIAE